MMRQKETQVCGFCLVGYRLSLGHGVSGWGGGEARRSELLEKLYRGIKEEESRFSVPGG